MGIFLFSSQVYFHFSGYSDIAVGLGYLFGLRLAVNFRQPFMALTPQAFWRRSAHHAQLLIRDYIFIPLALLKNTRAWQAVALIVAMALAGLWHGANWTFIVWGVGWALAMLLWHLANRYLTRLGAAQSVLTFGIWLVLLVFFRSGDVGAALNYITVMFGAGAGVAGTAPLPNDGAGGAVDRARLRGVAGTAVAEGCLHTRRTVLLMRRLDGPLLRMLIASLAFWLLLLPKVQENPFIYFRF